MKSERRNWSRYLAAILAFGALGCSSSTQPQPTVPFPNSVGTTWVYAIYDSVYKTRDTVEVRITDEIQIELYGQIRPATRWKLTPAKRDSIWYVFTMGDTVRIWGGNEDRAQYSMFDVIFPLSVGQIWFIGGECGANREYCTVVTETKELPVPGRGSAAAYFFTWWSRAPNGGLKRDWWFAPGVGFVQIKFWSRWTPFVNLNETWDLISYRIAN